MSTKTLKTLVNDIHSLFQEPHKVNHENAEAFGREFAELVTRRLEEEAGERTPTLRMSNLGMDCERKLWFSINTPQLGEKLPGDAHIKFLYGDLVELLVLFLAREAGHRVEGMQDELEINGVKGHRDAIVDGVLVDVKSASSPSYRKFADGSIQHSDPFGYVPQLNAYLEASQRDDLVEEKDRAAFIAVDKQLGHITVLEVEKDGKDYHREVDRKKSILVQPEPPTRPYLPVPDGRSGNLKLGVQCSYCAFKFPCWGKLRVFAYSDGPHYLVKTVREPNVPEIT
jgi:hypothetical protein